MMMKQEIKEIETAVEVFAKDTGREMVFDRDNSRHGALVVIINGTKHTFDSVSHFVGVAMGML